MDWLRRGGARGSDSGSNVRPRWARILLAAVRLAAIYAAGVLILVIPLFVRARYEGFEPNREAWLGLPLIGAFCFALGFVALAAVRRLGFALLWGLLVWWWISMSGHGPVVFLDQPFLIWTVFAAPLYVLSAIGLTVSASRRWKVEVVVTLATWAIIAGLAYFSVHPGGDVLRIQDPGPRFQVPLQLQGYLYAVWPFVIGARELGRVVGALWRSRKEASSA